MRYTTSGGAAMLAICLLGLQPAKAESINDEKDALAFIVREAEIAREKAAAQGGQTTAKTEKKTAAASAKAGASAKAAAAAAASTKAAAAAAAAPEADKPSTRASRALAAPVGSDGLKALVARHAAANGVPFALADAVVRIESRYNPRASSAGNYGLMQIRHQTARGMGYSGGAGGLLDAETNARYAMKYLAQAYKLAGGDTCRTVMKYQSGHMTERMSGANRTYCAKVRTITARS